MSTNFQGMLAPFVAQMAQPGQLSDSQRSLVNNTGRAFGGLFGGFQNQKPTTSQQAMAAALEAQKYGHVQDYANYMNMAKAMQGEEGASARQADAIASQESMTRLRVDADERMQQRKLQMDKYGINANTASRKEVAMLDNAAALERIQLQIEGTSGQLRQKLEAEAAENQKRLDQLWEIANMEEKGRMSRAKLAASASAGKDMPSKGDIEALALIARGLPDNLKDKLNLESWLGKAKQGEILKLVGPVWKAVQNGHDPFASMKVLAETGHDPSVVMPLVESGYKWNDKKGAWEEPAK